MIKELFVTEVGSYMWKMNTPESDRDYNRVYQVGTRDILSGIGVKNTIPDKTYTNEENQTVDEKAQEIGHLCNQIIKGNVNAIWSVCSPVVIKDHPCLHELRRITLANLSKATYASVKGMTISQSKDHIKRAGVMPEGKALRTAWRTGIFGSVLLSSGTVKFEPITHSVSVEDVEWVLKDLDYSYEHSILPEKPDEKPFRDFLLKLRLENIIGGE